MVATVHAAVAGSSYCIGKVWEVHVVATVHAAVAGSSRQYCISEAQQAQHSTHQQAAGSSWL